MDVVVVTNTELGWDCVIGVFGTIDLAIKYLNEDKEIPLTQRELENICYVFHNETISN